MSAAPEQRVSSATVAASWFLLHGMDTVEIARLMLISEPQAVKLLHIGLASSRAAVFRNLKQRGRA